MLQTLTGELEGADAATFVLRTLAAGGEAGTRLMVVRRRRLRGRLEELIEIRNHGPVDQPATVTLHVGTDFADLFAVKEGRPATEGIRRTWIDGQAIVYSWRLEDLHRRVRLSFEGNPHITHDGATWRITVPARSTVTVAFTVDVALGERWPSRRRPIDRGGWHERRPPPPRLRTEHPGLAIAFERAIADLDALRLYDPVYGGPPVVAAGAPWFMTLFGRDSIITGLMALPIDPILAYGVARALADLQGDHDDPVTEEEPGRILHEVRFIDSKNPSFRDGRPYFGTVDATPLFVILVGELSRWGLPDDLLRPLSRTSTGPWPGSPGDRLRTTATSRTGGPPLAGWPTRGGRTRGTACAITMVGSPMPRSACARSRATSMPPTWRGLPSPCASTTPRGRATSSDWPPI